MDCIRNGMSREHMWQADRGGCAVPRLRLWKLAFITSVMGNDPAADPLGPSQRMAGAGQQDSGIRTMSF